MQASVPKSRPADGFYVWSFPGSPARIHLSFDVISQIEEYLSQLPRDQGPVECRGLLLGGIPGGGITEITKFKLLENAAPRTLETALTRLENSAGNLRSVGYFRVQDGGQLQLNEEDLALAGEFFRVPQCAFLLVQRLPIGPPNAGFFFWDGDRIQADFSFMEFPFDAQSLGAPDHGKSQAVPQGQVKVEISSAPLRAVADSLVPSAPGLRERFPGHSERLARQASLMERRIRSGFGALRVSLAQHFPNKKRNIKLSVTMASTEARAAAPAKAVTLVPAVRRFLRNLTSPIRHQLPVAVSRTRAAFASILPFVRTGWERSAPWVKKLSVAALVVTLVSFAGLARFENMLAVNEKTLGRMVRDRATIQLTDTFQPGLAGWKGAGKWMSMWALDREGAVWPGPLALYDPSLALVNYRLEFITSIARGGIGWVVRASDRENYYAMRLSVIRSGSLPLVSLTRYPVLAGSKGLVTTVQLRPILASTATWRVRVEVDGMHFKLFAQDQLVDTWMSEDLASGGVGFFTERGEKAAVSSMSITSQDDFVGRICADLARE